MLLDSHPERGLGPAIAWALRHGADSLHILTDRGAGTIARRAALFDWPVQVSQLIDRSSSPAAPVGREVEPVVAEAHLGFTELIAAAGAQPVHEFGVLAGEVAGLEVCRVVDDAASGEARLDIGVGAADRETFQMLHAGRAQLEALSDVVVHVRAVRSPGADRHPLNQLAASRLLRDRLVLDASAIGLGQVVPVSPPTPRANLKDEVPCVALSADGTTVVVCSAGIDLDVVPFALDAASLHSAQRCLIVVAERDIVDIERGNTEAMGASQEIVTALGQVKTGVEQISAAAEQAEKAAEQAATAAKQQSQGADELSAAIEEIASLADELQSA